MSEQFYAELDAATESLKRMELELGFIQIRQGDPIQRLAMIKEHADTAIEHFHAAQQMEQFALDHE